MRGAVKGASHALRTRGSWGLVLHVDVGRLARIYEVPPPPVPDGGCFLDWTGIPRPARPSGAASFFHNEIRSK